MKLFKKLMIAVLTVALVFSTYSAFKLEPKAATGTTYYVLYNAGQYWAQPYAWSWEDPVKFPFEASMLDQKMVDGDNLVIYTAGKTFNMTFTKKIGELTIAENGFAVVTAPSFEKVLVCEDSTAAINGDVLDAYVYNNGICNFNDNVNVLHLVQAGKKAQTVNVLGTVGCLEESKVGETLTNCYYNFAKGACVVKDGGLFSEPGTFTKDPTLYVPVLPANPIAPILPTLPGTGGNDLDDVPKTGEMNLGLSIVLLALSALSTAGAYIVYRKKA